MDAQDRSSMSAISPPGFTTPQTFIWYFWNETTYEIQKAKKRLTFLHKCVTPGAKGRAPSWWEVTDEAGQRPDSPGSFGDLCLSSECRFLAGHSQLQHQAVLGRGLQPLHSSVSHLSSRSGSRRGKGAEDQRPAPVGQISTKIHHHLPVRGRCSKL